ncbi:MAG: hypothetical protein J6U10_01360 [Lachnospiraceae bacterium]|nr:hypothetical protein [Lachnospiraceae bacterium]
MKSKKQSVAKQRKEALRSGNIPEDIRKQFEDEIKKRRRIALISVIAAVLALGIFALLYAGVPAINIKRRALYGTKDAVKTVSTPIEIEDNEVLVGEDGDLRLYINPKTLIFRVKNAQTNSEWRSSLKGAAAGADTALLSLSYLGKDNVLYEWNTDTYCTQIGTYSLGQIENGVMISMDVNEGESNRFYEYLPRKMSVERYEQFFAPGIKKLFEDGKISEDEFERYELALSIVYSRSILEECYAVTYVGNPPASASRQLIEVSKLLGYTHEMLEDDAKTFGFSIAEVQVARFKLNMYIQLKDGDLVVRVPSNEVENLNDFFVLQNVKVLPNFGSCTPKQQETGYFLVPDGAGALIKLNTFKTGLPNYRRAVYDNDFFSDYYYMSEYGEELMMPVFGAIYGELGDEKQSFLAIIEEGAETSFIYAGLAGTGDEGAKTNYIYASFDTVQYTSAKVYGAYSENVTSYLVKSPYVNVNYTIRYKFFENKKSYYDMAVAYRDQILKESGKTLSFDTKERLYLDVIGSLDITDHFLGIPYSRTISMTKYKELEEILKKLSGYNMTVSYNGIINGGLNNTVGTKAKPVSMLGSAKDLKALQDYASSNNVELALGVNLAKVYKTSLGYRSGINSVKDFSNVVATVSKYTLSTGKLAGAINSRSDYYELVSPQFLMSVVSKFTKAEKNFDRYYIPDMGKLFYADYDNSEMVDDYTAAGVLDEAFAALNGKHLIIDDPFMKNIKYADLATSISRESSDYGTFTYTIPFRQLVLNGLAAYTTKNVNMSARGVDYYILQAAELGSIPKLTITFNNEDELKSSDYTYLYAVCFEKQEPLIKEVYEGVKKAFEEIGSKEISGHRLLMNNVCETTYANGKTVTVNYNLYDVTLEDGTVLGGESYIVK